MQKKSQAQLQEQSGFILVTAMLILLVLTIMGIAMNRTTVTEMQIAGNDRLHKQSFYQADGATEFAAEALEQNIACLNFAQNGTGSTSIATPEPGTVLDGNIAVRNSSLQFWQNVIGTYSSLPGNPPFPSDIYRDMWLPPTYTSGAPHTNIAIEGISDFTAGASILFASGYLGLGRSMAAGGVTLDYTIDAQRIDLNNAESVIRVRYHHVVGKEDPFCRYN